jgi:hypothetical protein
MPAPIIGVRAYLGLRLDGAADTVVLDLYSRGFVLVRRQSLGGSFQAGWNQVPFDAAGLPNGVYFLKVKVLRGGEASPEKLGKTAVLR